MRMQNLMGLAATAVLMESVVGDASAGGGSPETAGQPRKPAKPKPEVETVEMEDGRKVEFAGKRKMLKDSVFDASGHVDNIRFDFRNGKVVTFKIPDIKTVDGQNLLQQFAAHGVEQKIGDETAGEDDVDDMVEAVVGIIDRLNKGEWSVRGQGGGMGGTSILIQALMEKSGKPIEAIRAFLAPLTQQDKMALRNSAQLKPIVEKLEAAKLAKSAKVDTDALLATL